MGCPIGLIQDALVKTYQLPVVQGDTEGFHFLPWAFSQMLGNILCEQSEQMKISEPKKGAWYHQYDWNFQQKIGYMLVLPVDCRVKDDKETRKIGCLLWTWVVMLVIYLNPVWLLICCKIAGSILKARAGLLSVKFLSMANDVFFRLPFAKVEEMETTGPVILIIEFSVILWSPGKWLEMEEYVWTT